MKVWTSLHKNHKIVQHATATSADPDPSTAFLQCLEQIYKALDVAEPVWVSKHERDISRFHRVVFRPADFLEPVHFDSMEIQIVDEK